MVLWPEGCPLCGDEGICYSVGVIRNHLGAQFGEYPVVTCEPCHTAYFRRLPWAPWERCDVNKRVIAFTKDPHEIDGSIKLEYSPELLLHTDVSVYTVFLTATDDAPV